jgi:Leucine-rich repeat (LRR) protein
MVINYEISRMLEKFQQNKLFVSILELKKSDVSIKLQNEPSLTFNFDFRRLDNNIHQNMTILSSRIKINAFEYFPNLRTLKFNRENDYLVLDDNVFSKLNHLVNLELKFRIGQIRKEMFVGLFNLRKLILKGCNLNSIENGSFKDIVRLETLDLSNNSNLCEITSEMFEGLINLKSLYLNDCKINSIKIDTFKIFSQLESLNLSSNQIVNIDSNTFSGLFELKCLDLCNNHIKSIDEDAFTHLKNLKFLYLSKADNLKNIDNFTFRALEKLSILHLCDDGLTKETLDSFPFENLENLTELVLKTNDLVKIKTGLLKNSKKLRKLCLRNANLSEIEVDFFANLTKLNHIDLAGNSLTQDELKVFENKLKNTTMYKNFLHFLSNEEKKCEF